MKNVWLAILLLALVAACEKKEIPFGDHPGAQIYHGITRVDVRCDRCHGPTGEGSGRAPALVHEGKTIARPLFIQTVLEGRGRMPAFGSVLSEKEIEAIAAWLSKVHEPPHANR